MDQLCCIHKEFALTGGPIAVELARRFGIEDDILKNAWLWGRVTSLYVEPCDKRSANPCFFCSLRITYH